MPVADTLPRDVRNAGLKYRQGFAPFDHPGRAQNFIDVFDPPQIMNLSAGCGHGPAGCMGQRARNHIGKCEAHAAVHMAEMVFMFCQKRHLPYAFFGIQPNQFHAVGTDKGIFCQRLFCCRQAVIRHTHLVPGGLSVVSCSCGFSFAFSITLIIPEDIAAFTCSFCVFFRQSNGFDVNLRGIHTSLELNVFRWYDYHVIHSIHRKERINNDGDTQHCGPEHQ